MNKVREEVVTATATYHDYYCDECGNFIETVEECDDGYFQSYETCDFEVMAKADGSWFKTEKELCEDCYEKLRKKYEDLFVSIGLKKEKL